MSLPFSLLSSFVASFVRTFCRVVAVNSFRNIDATTSAIDFNGSCVLGSRDGTPYVCTVLLIVRAQNINHNVTREMRGYRQRSELEWQYSFFLSLSLTVLCSQRIQNV